MKLTAKRLAAQDAATKHLKLKYVSSIPNEQLYAKLQDNGYIWDRTQSAWVRGSTSMFKDEFGEPSGIVRLRVMAHPDDVDKAVAHLRKLSPMITVEVSDHYPNRKGIGTRVYITCKLVQ